MSLFSPLSGLVGGSLIGLSAATLLLGNGDILGCSGIVSSAVLNPLQALSSKSKWKLVFLSSFLVTSSLYNNFAMESDEYYALELAKIQPSSNIPFVSDLGYAISGFLVGFGTRLGNGCTSGHGICGLARLSKRSFAAVMTFMATGIATASLLPNDGFLRDVPDSSMFPTETSSVVGKCISALTVVAILPLILKKVKNKTTSTSNANEEANDDKKFIVGALSASIFSVGLAISGMAQQYKVFGFLDVKRMATGTWDGTLALVMGGGVIVSAASYHWVKGYNYFGNDNALSCPLLLDKSCGKFNVPSNTVIDLQLLLGSAIFGVGWGLGGLCPGPALFVAASGFPKVMYYWWPANLIGVVLAEQAKKLF